MRCGLAMLAGMTALSYAHTGPFKGPFRPNRARADALASYPPAPSYSAYTPSLSSSSTTIPGSSASTSSSTDARASSTTTSSQVATGPITVTITSTEKETTTVSISDDPRTGGMLPSSYSYPPSLYPLLSTGFPKPSLNASTAFGSRTGGYSFPTAPSYSLPAGGWTTYLNVTFSQGPRTGGLPSTQPGGPVMNVTGTVAAASSTTLPTVTSFCGTFADGHTTCFTATEASTPAGTAPASGSSGVPLHTANATGIYPKTTSSAPSGSNPIFTGPPRLGGPWPLPPYYGTAPTAGSNSSTLSVTTGIYPNASSPSSYTDTCTKSIVNGTNPPSYTAIATSTSILTPTTSPWYYTPSFSDKPRNGSASPTSSSLTTFYTTLITTDIESSTLATTVTVTPVPYPDSTSTSTSSPAATMSLLQPRGYGDPSTSMTTVGDAESSMTTPGSGSNSTTTTSSIVFVTITDYAPTTSSSSSDSSPTPTQSFTDDPRTGTETTTVRDTETRTWNKMPAAPSYT